jgi:LDH2 family malate/lactate/ureidoglycolate dehydrogenase
MANPEAHRYRAADLIEYGTALFAAAGCDGDKPAAIAAGLVEADLLGHTTHGLQLAPTSANWSRAAWPRAASRWSWRTAARP